MFGSNFPRKIFLIGHQANQKSKIMEFGDIFYRLSMYLEASDSGSLIFARDVQHRVRTRDLLWICDRVPSAGISPVKLVRPASMKKTKELYILGIYSSPQYQRMDMRSKIVRKVYDSNSVRSDLGI